VTLPASIRVNVRAPFPTQVRGAAFISVAKSNGIWTVKPDYRLIAENPLLTTTQVVALQDTVTGAWSYMSASLLLSASLSSYREVTVAGSVTVQPTDIIILLNKSPSGASTINLPNSATRGGVPVTVKDITGDANTNNITVVPATGETIDGLSASAAAANGIAVIDKDYGSRTFYPLQSGGWYVI
jgi:hypothetical protein